MRRLPVRASALVVALFCVHVAAVGVAADAPLITSEQAYRELAQHGHLNDVRIDGGFDLARLQAPAGTERLTLAGVEILGKLHASGASPAVALLIDNSTLHRIDLRDARLRGGLAIENSVVPTLARFDSAQFDGPFVLHGTVFEQKANFRRARFGSSVEIVDCRFDEPEGARGGISFADARFAGPASFNRSQFSSNVSFESSRFEGDERVPVVGRRDLHGVDVLARHQLAEVPVGHAVLVVVVLVVQLLALEPPGFVHVTHGDDLDFRISAEGAHVALALDSQPDDAQDDAIGRRRRARQAQG